MQRASAGGLAPDEARTRLAVTHIHNASAATEQQLIELWANKSVQEAQRTLASDDVSVTNQKDKEQRMPSMFERLPSTAQRPFN